MIFITQSIGLVLPWSWQHQQSKNAIVQKGIDLSKQLDSCESLLTKYFELANQHGTPHEVQSASLLLIYAIFLKQQLGILPKVSHKLEEWVSYFGSCLI